MNEVKKYGILILAAGSSSRMGEPKQLLSFQHKSLLEHTITAAKMVTDGSVVVILGENYRQIEESIDPADIKIVHNPGWIEGISSSIRLGMKVLMKENKDLDGVILSVCDQPFVMDGIFNALIEKADLTGKSIVASAYAETLGVPVLFTRNYFTDLAGLKGKEGAKTLLVKYKEDVAAVVFEKGAIDIDTPDDYHKLIDSDHTGDIQ